jgi:hypothetical protein
MEHGARRCRCSIKCNRCGRYYTGSHRCTSSNCITQPIKTDAEKAIEFMEAYVLARARAKSGNMDIYNVLHNAKEAYLAIHKRNLDEIRKEMSK